MTSAAASRRRMRSAFFPDTDDDDSSETSLRVPPLKASLRVGPQGRAVLTRNVPKSPLKKSPSPSPKPFSSGAYMGAIEFPKTRSVLWDRRPLGKAQVLLAKDVFVPKVTLTATTLEAIHEQVLRRSNGPQLIGHVIYTTEMLEDGWNVCGTSFSAHTNPRLKKPVAPPSSFPVFVVLKESKEIEQLAPHEEMIHNTQYAFQTNAPLDISFSMRLVVSLFMPTQLNLVMEMIAPPAELQLVPIRNLPLLLTPLAKSLMKLQSSYEGGLATLDKTRKMVPLLSTDALAREQPLVGVWVQTTSPTTLFHQLLLYYTKANASLEQVWVAPSTCLLVKYPTEAKQWLPEFFEAKLTNPTSLATFRSVKRVTVGATQENSVELQMLQSHREVYAMEIGTCNVPEAEVPSVESDSDASSLSDNQPTPIPCALPTNPIPKPVCHPRTLLPPLHSPSAKESSSSAQQVSKDVLVQHQEQMEAMQQQIQQLQDQLRAVQLLYEQATTKTMHSVGTNTSTIFPNTSDLVQDETSNEPTNNDTETTVVHLPLDEPEKLPEPNSPVNIPTEDEHEDSSVVLEMSALKDANESQALHPEDIEDYLSEPASVTYPLLRTHFDSDALPAAPALTIADNPFSSFDIPRIRYAIANFEPIDSEDEEIEIQAIEAKYLKKMIK